MRENGEEEDLFPSRSHLSTSLRRGGLNLFGWVLLGWLGLVVGLVRQDILSSFFPFYLFSVLNSLTEFQS
jgi:hypothetical protein